jgi:type IV secretory pathway TrbL component
MNIIIIQRPSFDSSSPLASSVVVLSVVVIVIEVVVVLIEVLAVELVVVMVGLGLGENQLHFNIKVDEKKITVYFKSYASKSR